MFKAVKEVLHLPKGVAPAKKCRGRKKASVDGIGTAMGSFDKWAGKKIKAAKKAAEKKKQGQSNANLGRQWGTNLSAQYDNDGKNIFPEPRGYAKDGGH